MPTEMSGGKIATTCGSKIEKKRNLKKILSCPALAKPLLQRKRNPKNPMESASAVYLFNSYFQLKMNNRAAVVALYF